MKKINILNNNWLLLFIFLLIIRISSPIGANFAFLILALYAARGGKYVIEAFAMSWIFTLLNPTIAPSASMGAFLRYLIILSGFSAVLVTSVYSKSIFKVTYFGFLTFLFCFIVLVHSLFISYFPSVSVLKIISWGLTFLTLLTAWRGLTEEIKLALYNKLENFLKLILILSIPLLFVPVIGFAKNGTGFQGLLNHPQAFGPTIAILAIIMGGRIISNYKINFKDFIFFIICIIFVMLSEARTAGLALILSLICAIFLGPILSHKKFTEVNRIFNNKKFYVVLIISFIIAILTSSLYVERLQSYMFKRSDSSSLIEAADASRGALIEKMLNNINQNKIFGIGFGVSSEPYSFKVEYDPYLGLPVSAVVEKGVLPIAVFEELGLTIGCLFFIWFIYALYKAAKIDAQKLSILLCIFLLNLGEYMFFSVGGMGMLLLIFFTASLSMPHKNFLGAMK